MKQSYPARLSNLLNIGLFIETLQSTGSETHEFILDKPDKLTDDEMNIMKQHPGKGAEILMSSIKQLVPIIPAIKHHHEFYDGTGYPDMIKSEAILLFARILKVADTVDAMGADRPYRKGRTMDVIIAELRRCSGTQFDSSVVDVFLKTYLPEQIYQS